MCFLSCDGLKQWFPRSIKIIKVFLSILQGSISWLVNVLSNNEQYIKVFQYLLVLVNIS